MNDDLVVLDEKPSIEPFMVECSFTLESDDYNGGDFEKNIGGSRSNKRLKFEGYATKELYNAMTDAVRNLSAREQ